MVRSTLADVARLAGVSLSTASKALNDRSGVNAQTREKVRTAAKELSFSGNSVARALSQGRSGTVGLLTSDLEGRFGLPVLMGAEDAFGAGEISVLLCDARGDAIRERRLLETLLSRRVDGLLVVGSYNDPRPSLGEVAVPVVYVLSPSESDGDTSVVPNNLVAGQIAGRHLASIGRRRIAHVPGVSGQRATVDRARGAADALQELGLSFVGDSDYGEWSERWGRSAVTRLLAEHPDIDAVLCDSDQIARGALEASRSSGRRVPEDIAIMGFDNWSPVATESNPGITSVDLQLELIGKHAAQLIFAGMDNISTQTTPPDPRLVIRGSTMAGA